MQKLGEFFLGGDLIEVKRVSVSVYQILADLVLLYFSDALFIASNNLGLSIGNGQACFLFHYYSVFDKE